MNFEVKMANWRHIGTLAIVCVAQMAGPAMAADLDTWLPLPPVLDTDKPIEWTATFDRTPAPAQDVDPTSASAQRQPRRGAGGPGGPRPPGGPGGPGGLGVDLANTPIGGVAEFVKQLRVPSPRLGNVELSAGVGGLHTESDQPSAKADMGMDAGPGSTFQVAAKYLVDKHVSITFGLNGAQAQTQAASTDPAAQAAAMQAATPRPKTNAMRGFTAISNIGPSMVQRLVSTTVQPTAAIQYAGPFGLNLSLGVASNPLDVTGAADVQFHATYRSDFRDKRLPALPAPLGVGVGPLAVK
ncbi:MAG: hypothetical protein JWM80_582 [Cyanobacteria bacterium RYN_339]|nr:hypothetical protein [Cyanobacteria bacterium RYN_339]